MWLVPWLILKPMTHLAVLYDDRGDWRKSPGVPSTAIAIFADRRDWRLKLSISDLPDCFWTEEKEINLIILWSEKACLFDVLPSGYSNRLKKDSAFQ